jgi:DNA-directed RNA polymerase subunit beta
VRPRERRRGDVCDLCGTTVQMKLKYDVEECQERGMTFAVPLKVTIRLVVWNKDLETGVKTIRDIKEQEVYFGDIPLMGDHGTFIINGTERVIVSQLHRSPGRSSTRKTRTCTSPRSSRTGDRGWSSSTTPRTCCTSASTASGKFLASVFLRALGLRSAHEILKTFYTTEELVLGGGRIMWKVSDSLVGRRSAQELAIPGSDPRPARRQEDPPRPGRGAEEVRRGSRWSWPSPKREGAFAAGDVVDPATGEVMLEANEELSERVIAMAQEKNVERIEIFFPEKDEIGQVLSSTLKKDPIQKHEEALIEIYRRLRPGDPPTLDSSRNLFENMFFNAQKYDFSRVGRLKLNTKLKLQTPLDEKVLHPADFYEVIRYLLKLRKNPTLIDDIDHLGNRRVRSVGELLENQFRIGLVRMERAIKEKMSVYQEMATAMPHDLINAKPVMAAIREFFGSSQLSQFMDQTNPLSEVTHKRRLSALGPGGLSRERAGFEVRDVHPTHYGRICPIETPEGPNIGLISSLSSYARINDFGFIESPYRRVKDGKVLDFVAVTNAGGNPKYKVGDVVEAHELVGADGRSKKKGVEFEPYCFYLSAWEEDQYIIAQANVESTRTTA